MNIMSGLSTIFLFAGLVWLFLALWVANDASKKGRSASFWFVVTLILGIIGILIYTISTSSESPHSKIECNECGATNVGNPNFCQNCGCEIEVQPEKENEREVVEIGPNDIGLASITCPQCGVKNSKRVNYCGVCNVQFKKVET